MRTGDDAVDQAAQALVDTWHADEDAWNPPPASEQQGPDDCDTSAQSTDLPGSCRLQDSMFDLRGIEAYRVVRSGGW